MAIVAGAVVLFASERLRADVVGLLVLAALAVSGLVSPEQAVSGFASPAVVTVWAMFMLGAGLVRSGVASSIGRAILRLGGHRELVLVMVIMFTEAALSAFMNNVAAVALLLPAVVDVARETGRPAGRYLLPLAVAAQLGGTFTQIGTPPNILVAAFTREQGLRQPFGMFSYSPVALPCLLVGVAFAASVGRRLLPRGRPPTATAGMTASELVRLYDLPGQMRVLRIPDQSAFAGMSLGESRLGAALGVHVLAIVRQGRTELAPDPDFVLHAGDRLVVEGRLDRLAEIGRQPSLVVTEPEDLAALVKASGMAVATVRLSASSSLIGQDLRGAQFRQRFRVTVVAIGRNGQRLTTGLRDTHLEAHDTLVVLGARDAVEGLASLADFVDFELQAVDDTVFLHPHRQHLVTLAVPPGSVLAGRSLAESRLGDALDFTVLAIVRGGALIAAPTSDLQLAENDLLIVIGGEHNLRILAGLQSLELDEEPLPDNRLWESEQVALAEAVLSPHTTLIGRTLRDVQFRDRYGLNVVAIWREGRALRSNLRDHRLRFGDALLLHGPRDRIRLLATEPDFLVLTHSVQPAPRRHLAPVAIGIWIAVIAAAVAEVLPIAIAAVLGAVAMVLSGCLTMEEAYRSVEWPVVFLIAAMLPLGAALQNTGAASLIGNAVADMVGRFGPRATLAAIYLLGALAVQFIPNSAVVVLLAPIGLSAANRLAVAPEPFLMAVAFAASAGFASPTGHAVNLMVMGPGGYRFRDYLRFGVPLILLMLGVLALVIPRVLPFAPSV